VNCPVIVTEMVSPCWPELGLTLSSRGVPGLTVNALLLVTTCVPVVTVRLRGPVAAVAAIEIWADRFVVLGRRVTYLVD
jgi:hypothetical protein